MADAAIAAVAVKLPPFWPEDPHTWIQQVEAQFVIRGITVDSTKFYHVVAALDPATARRLRDTIKYAPEGSRYDALKTLLVNAFGLTESKCANHILRMRSLGDRKPSELMDELLALAEDHTACFLLKQIFINLLPPELQLQLATTNFTDARRFSLQADMLWEVKCAASSSDFVNSVDTKYTAPVLDVINKVGAKAAPRRALARSGKHNADGLCFYHTRWGANAHKCLTPCSWSGNGQAGRQ